MLAYASDMTLLDTALFPHGRMVFDPDLQAASLDHAMWFHRPFRADEWLLYAEDSPSASGGARLQPRQPVQPRRQAGCLGRPGRADPAPLTRCPHDGQCTQIAYKIANLIRQLSDASQSSANVPADSAGCSAAIAIGTELDSVRSVNAVGGSTPPGMSRFHAGSVRSSRRTAD